jgi:hypothetical protein
VILYSSPDTLTLHRILAYTNIDFTMKTFELMLIIIFTADIANILTAAAEKK